MLKDKSIKPPEVKFTYVLSGTGWAEGSLNIGNEEMKFETCYLSDPITLLFDALVEISPVYASTVYRYDESQGEKVDQVNFAWSSGPMAYDWYMRYHPDNTLDLQVRFYDDDEDYDPGEIILEVSCDFFDFLKAVLDEFTCFIKKYGLVGYYDTWASKAEFPIAQFLKLKYYLHQKSRFECIPEKAKYPNSKFDFVYYSDLINELKLFLM